MNCRLIVKPIAVLILSFTVTISFILLQSDPNLNINPEPSSSPNNTMAGRSFILWLHGLGDSGPANEPIKNLFTSTQFNNTIWSFPSAPFNPVTCNNGHVMPSWFDIHEIPVTADSPKDESSVLKAVQNVHAMIDKEVAAGTNPNNVFVCGFSQGGLSSSPFVLDSTWNTHTCVFVPTVKISMIIAGALTLASVLLYPKTLGGGAIFSGWVPLNSSIIERITPEAKKTPILWCHGIADKTVLFESGQAGPPFLEQVGMSCEFKAYAGLGHSINNEELRYLESWIKSRMQSSS